MNLVVGTTFLGVPSTTMFWKQDADHVVISADGETESFRFGAKELAHVVYASAWPGSRSVLITAARTEADKADVMSGRRGNYRAYSASAQGLERLTEEYTNTAIPLPQGGLAYSNGGSLVVLSGGQRRVHKVSRFNWGPTSLSCNASGQRIALTRWKGDDRKLAFTDFGSDALTVSRFSYFSYLLMEEEILYVFRSDVMSFDPASGKSRSLTTRAIIAELLDLVGIGSPRRPQLEIRFGPLSLLNGVPVAVASIQVMGTWDWLWHGVIQLPYASQPLKILLPIERPWGASELISSGNTLTVILNRHENARLVEQRTITTGPKDKSVAAGWWPLSQPALPSFGFQFMPSAGQTGTDMS